MSGGRKRDRKGLVALVLTPPDAEVQGTEDQDSLRESWKPAKSSSTNGSSLENVFHAIAYGPRHFPAAVQVGPGSGRP